MVEMLTISEEWKWKYLYIYNWIDMIKKWGGVMKWAQAHIAFDLIILFF